MCDSSSTSTCSHPVVIKNKRPWKTIPIIVLFGAVLFVAPVMGQGDKWDKLMATANSQEEKGQTNEAESLYRNALKYFEENEEHGPSAATRLHIMFGDLYFKQDRYPESEASIEKALKIYQEKKESPNGYTAIALSKLATLYLNQEKYLDHARSYFRQALNIFQKEGWKD